MKLTIDDITIWNGDRFHPFKHTFSIEKITEKVLNENKMGELEVFFEENGVQVDQFNIEYMGILTGIIYGSRVQLIEIINKFLKTSHL